MPQGRLFPLTIKRTEPSPFNSADCSIVGVGDDGLLYILKRVSDGHPLVPATEWICSQLARDIGLAVPSFHIAVLPGSGELAFASREEGGVMDEANKITLLQNPAQLLSFAPTLCRWFAYDLFTQNTDRHIGNFLFRQSILGPVLLGIDFSRAMLTQDWPSARPPLPDCHTVTNQRILHKAQPFPPTAAVEIMDKLGNVSDDWLETTMKDIPDPWLDAKVRRQITRWWRNNRHKRIRLIRKHLHSGRYLRICASPRCP